MTNPTENKSELRSYLVSLMIVGRVKMCILWVDRQIMWSAISFPVIMYSDVESKIEKLPGDPSEVSPVSIAKP